MGCGGGPLSIRVRREPRKLNYHCCPLTTTNPRLNFATWSKQVYIGTGPIKIPRLDENDDTVSSGTTLQIHRIKETETTTNTQNVLWKLIHDRRQEELWRAMEWDRGVQIACKAYSYIRGPTEYSLPLKPPDVHRVGERCMSVERDVKDDGCDLEAEMHLDQLPECCRPDIAFVHTPSPPHMAVAMNPSSEDARASAETPKPPIAVAILEKPITPPVANVAISGPEESNDEKEPSGRIRQFFSIEDDDTNRWIIQACAHEQKQAGSQSPTTLACIDWMRQRGGDSPTTKPSVAWMHRGSPTSVSPTTQKGFDWFAKYAATTSTDDATQMSEFLEFALK